VKTKLVLIAAMFAALVSSAQTNAIIFPQLLSPTNSVLMTNAEFRCYFGNKIFFRNDAGYQSFHPADLNTNVLATLGTTSAKLEVQQKALDDAEKARQQKIIDAAKEKQLLAEQKAEAYKKAKLNVVKSPALIGFQNPPETTENQSIGGTQ